MNLDISPNLQSRLMASAQAESMSLDAFLERLIDERDELMATIERSQRSSESLSLPEIRNKIESGFRQSEHGEMVDGDTFTDGLLNDLDVRERKRHVG